MALDGEDLRALPLPMRRTNLDRLLARRPDGIFVAPFEQGARSDPSCSARRVTWAWKGLCRNGVIGPIAAAARPIG